MMTSKINLKNSKKGSKLSVVPSTDYDAQTDPLPYYLNQWILFVKSSPHSKVTVENYQRHGERFVWWYYEHAKLHEKVGSDLNRITPAHIREYITYLKLPLAFRWGKPVVRGTEKLSTASVNTMAVFVRVFFNWLAAEEIIKVSPFNRNIKILGKQENLATNHHKNLKEDQLKAIFGYFNQPEKLATETGCRNFAIVSLLLDSGMRVGELISMRNCDLDLNRGRAVIRGKSGERTCFFSSSTRAILTEYNNRYRREHERFNRPQDKFWLTAYGGELKAGGVSAFVNRASHETGIEFNPHKFRHTFASLMVGDVGIYELKELLGHRSLSTTEIYTHSNPDKLQEIYGNHSPLAKLDLGQMKVRGGRGRPKGSKNISKTDDNG